MKLFPAALLIIAVFLAGFLFLTGRRYSKKILIIPAVVILLILVYLLKLVGKLVLLVAAVTFVVFRIASKRA